MKKITLIVGAAAGFVLGSRAGRAPYEKLEARVRKALNREDVQDTLDHATGVAAEKLSTVTEKVEEKLPGDHDKPGGTEAGSDIGVYP